MAQDADWDYLGTPPAPSDLEHEFAILHKQHGPIRTLAGITSGLSIVGSLLIILSYVCFRDLRSRTRLILVHISIADFGVGVANLVGVSAYFDHHYEHKGCLPKNISFAEPFRYIVCPPEKHIQGFCISQAAFAHYFTVCSIIWTTCLSIFLYIRIVHQSIQKGKYVFYASVVLSYSIPLLLVVSLLATNQLGFSPYTSEGWCAVILKDPTTGDRHILLTIINFDLWVYLTVFLVVILSISTHVHIRSELSNPQRLVNTERYRQALQKLDYKFLLIPVAFVILRIWSCIVEGIFIYAGLHARDVDRHLLRTFIVLSGIGDSGQGLANAILFVLFTKTVRGKFWSCLTCRRLRERSQHRQSLLSEQLPRSKPVLRDPYKHWSGLIGEDSI